MREIEESEGGEVVLGTRVVRIDEYVKEASLGSGGGVGDGSQSGWVVQTESGGEGGERSAVLAKVVINAAGLK